MRFVLDEDTPAAVGRYLQSRGHECWSAPQAKLGGADDDDICVYAQDAGAICVSHDVELAQKRRERTFGPHVWLHCHQRRALTVVESHVEQLEALLAGLRACVIEVKVDSVTYHAGRWT